MRNNLSLDDRISPHRRLASIDSDIVDYGLLDKIPLRLATVQHYNIPTFLMI
jgi:hypothetical protein